MLQLIFEVDGISYVVRSEYHDWPLSMVKNRALISAAKIADYRAKTPGWVCEDASGKELDQSVPISKCPVTTVYLKQME